MKKTTPFTSKTTSGFLSSFLDGLGFAGYTPKPHAYPHASTSVAMQGDWGKVGRSFKTVIDKENAKTAA